MRRRTREDWLELFGEQRDSGLSVAAFCERKGLNASYFYQRKRHYGWSGGEPAAPAAGFVELKPPVRSCAIHLKWHSVEIEIPPGTSVAWVAKLIRELADAPVQ